MQKQLAELRQPPTEVKQRKICYFLAQTEYLNVTLFRLKYRSSSSSSSISYENKKGFFIIELIV